MFKLTLYRLKHYKSNNSKFYKELLKNFNNYSCEQKQLIYSKICQSYLELQNENNKLIETVQNSKTKTLSKLLSKSRNKMVAETVLLHDIYTSTNILPTVIAAEFLVAVPAITYTLISNGVGLAGAFAISVLGATSYALATFKYNTKDGKMVVPRHPIKKYLYNQPLKRRKIKENNYKIELIRKTISIIENNETKKIVKQKI